MPPAAQPDGEAAPADGALPASALEGRDRSALGVYVHIPFCAARCGYCDFNTYTAGESSGGVDPAKFSAVLADEVDFAAGVLGDRVRPLDTVFFGGGTPTLLPAADLVAVLDRLRDRFGLRDDAEVSIEANPDSVDLRQLEDLRSAGVNRISFGMQSHLPHVLRVLDRTHDPERVPVAVGWARSAGFESVSLDLIYGTPGESLADWQHTVDHALSNEPDHVSAYALIVEQGTALARRVRRGEVPAPVDDDQADKYLACDERLTAAGLEWYEISNWARDATQHCRHNLGYWHSDDWWGIGPGAHSHVGGVRWWNIKHPAAYAARLAEGHSPAHARELLDEPTRTFEAVMLTARLRSGLVLDLINDRAQVDDLVDRSLASVQANRLTLTQRGRLLADGIVADLTG